MQKNTFTNFYKQIETNPFSLGAKRKGAFAHKICDTNPIHWTNNSRNRLQRIFRENVKKGILLYAKRTHLPRPSHCEEERASARDDAAIYSALTKEAYEKKQKSETKPFYKRNTVPLANVIDKLLLRDCHAFARADVWSRLAMTFVGNYGVRGVCQPQHDVGCGDPTPH